MFPVRTTDLSAERGPRTALRSPGTVDLPSKVALTLALACVCVLTTALPAYGAWAAQASGAVRARAGALDPPPAPKVAGAGLGCLLSLRAKVTWGDPGPNATFDVYDTNNTKVGGPYSSAGTAYFTGVALLGYGPSFYLVRSSGLWTARGPVGTCGN